MQCLGLGLVAVKRFLAAYEQGTYKWRDVHDVCIEKVDFCQFEWHRDNKCKFITVSNPDASGFGAFSFS